MTPTTPTTTADNPITHEADPKIDAPIALAPREPKPAPTPVRMGLVPTTLDEAWRLAKNFAESELLPKAFRGKPADVLVAIELGAELGLAPMQSVQSIAVINGRPSVWGDGLLAIVMASPLYHGHDEYYEVGGQRRDGLTLDDMKADTTCAVCTFIRRGKAGPVTSRFTVGQAKKAALWNKEGPWIGYPDRMLKMRARGFAARDCFPDLLRGLHTAEEARDIPPEPDDRPSIADVRRVSDTRHDFVDRTADTRQPEPAPIDAPLVIGPLAVVDVKRFIWGAQARLADGTLVDVSNPDDVAELDKLVGTPHLYRFECHRGRDGALRVQSFAIAD